MRVRTRRSLSLRAAEALDAETFNRILQGICNQVQTRYVPALQERGILAPRALTTHSSMTSTGISLSASSAHVELLRELP